MKRSGITVAEAIVAISLAMVVLGIAMPVLSDAREAARSIQCAKQITTIIQGSFEYQEVNLRMPPLSTGPGIVSTVGQAGSELQNHQHTGAMAYILPFIGLNKIFDSMPEVATRADMELGGNSEFFNFTQLLADPGMTTAFNAQPESIICPSNASYRDAFIQTLYFWGIVQTLDSSNNAFIFTVNSTAFGRTSYLPVLGGFKAERVSEDRAIDLSSEQVAGAMRNRLDSIMADEVLDGSSNTVCWAESVGWIEPKSPDGPPQLTGANFALFNMSIVTGDRWNFGDGILFGSSEASLPWLIGSMHPEGNNVAMCDGSIRFLSRNTSRGVATALGCGGDGWIVPRQ